MCECWDVTAAVQQELHSPGEVIGYYNVTQILASTQLSCPKTWNECCVWFRHRRSEKSKNMS